jgi:hypothetical protein
VPFRSSRSPLTAKRLTKKNSSYLARWIKKKPRVRTRAKTTLSDVIRFTYFT